LAHLAWLICREPRKRRANRRAAGWQMRRCSEVCAARRRLFAGLTGMEYQERANQHP
jgi:hypothetical protein